MATLGMNFVTQGCVRSETSEKLECDDILNENGMCLRSRGLQNEAPRLPKPPQEIFWTPKGALSALWGKLSGASWGFPGTLLSAPRLLWDTFWRSRKGNSKRFGIILLSPGDVQHENSDKLEFADPLNENAMFLRSQGLQNDAKMVPKRPERRKRGREEAKREQRSAKSALKSVVGALWGKFLRFRGSLGEARWNARLDWAYLTEPAFRRLWALKVRKSAVR